MKSVWIPDPKDGGYREGLLESGDLEDPVSKCLVVVGHEKFTHKSPEVGKVNPPKFEKCEDMVNLTFLNDASVFWNLKTRYQAKLIHTYSGLFVVVVNPYKRYPLYTHRVCKIYLGKRRKAASEAQKELVAQGKVQKKTFIGSEDGQWSEGLVSAARMVAAATHNLCEAANSLVQGNSSEEKLIAAAKQVSAATAQLLVACKVKADADSVAMKRLEGASNAVRRATDELVKAAQGAIERNEEDSELLVNTTAGSVNIIAEEVEAREAVYKMEKQLRDAQRRLEGVHRKKYKNRGTDSETDQSGYESSGYEYTSSPQTYTSYRQAYTSSPQVNTPPSNTSSLFKSNLSYSSEPEPHPGNGSQNPDSSIESGPSFNESLQRFKTASGHNAQMANRKSSMSTRTSSSHVQRRVEETRTMITQSSQKSYHIE